MGALLLLIQLFSFEARSSSVFLERACPHEKLESCRWDIRVQEVDNVIRFNWTKSIISRHIDKPLAHPIVCNVDRDFDTEAGGYIRVWFEGETEYCDPMVSDPKSCGVEILPDMTGFRVTAPEGKTLAHVQHYSTLNIQCGDFTKTDFAKNKWKALIGWKRDLPGDRTYVGRSPDQSGK